MEHIAYYGFISLVTFEKTAGLFDTFNAADREIVWKIVRRMVTANKMKFCKNEDCPSSEELVDFQNGDIELDRGSAICAHLAVCEFCASEVEFYSRYPQSNDDALSEFTEIPAPLFQLAEAILNNRHADLRELNTLLRENEELVNS